MASVTERARALIADGLGVALEKVTLDAKLVDDLGADSLDMVELIMAFEEEFDLPEDNGISDQEAEAIETVRDIIDLLAGKVVIPVQTSA